MSKSAIIISLLLMSCSETFASRRGNGGDGVIINIGTPQEKVLFYDTFERKVLNLRSSSTHKEYLKSKSRERGEKRIYFNEGSEHFRLKNSDTLIYGDESRNGIFNSKDISYLKDMLFELSSVFPSLTLAIIDTINELEWELAPVDLRPNPDTASFLDFNETDKKIIGCARTVDGIVFVSPICASRKMEPDQKAIMILHEATYHLIDSMLSVEDSLPVRSLVVHLLRSSRYNQSPMVSGEKAAIEYLRDLGLDELAEKEIHFWNFFKVPKHEKKSLPSSHTYSSTIICTDQVGAVELFLSSRPKKLLQEKRVPSPFIWSGQLKDPEFNNGVPLRLDGGDSYISQDGQRDYFKQQKLAKFSDGKMYLEYWYEKSFHPSTNPDDVNTVEVLIEPLGNSPVTAEVIYTYAHHESKKSIFLDCRFKD